LKNNRSGDPLKELIDSDPHLKSLFENITSIPGVGIVTAAKCIVIADERPAAAV
jgi:transposase